MAVHDRIRLIGLLREGPAQAGPSYCARRRWRRERARRIGGALLGLVAACALVGCGQNTILAHPTEKLVSDFVYTHTRFRPADVRCPAGVSAQVGREFDCHFTGPEGRYIAHLRVLSVHGRSVEDYITTRRAGP